MQVLQFSAYPNFSKNFLHEFQSQDKKGTIIFDEDIQRFSVWWEGNVNCYIPKEAPDRETQKKHDKVRDMLLAVWCTDKDKVDVTKCSLERCIREIDERLKSGQLTYRRTNPHVVPAPPFVKTYLGLENLTKQQHDILQSTEMLLWINGPAGSGKTVILMAKIIQLIKNDENAKVVLFVRTGWEDNELKIKKRHYQSVFDKAEIKSVMINTNNSFHTPAVVSQTIEEKKTEHQVMIVHMNVSDLIWIEDIISTIYDCHVFIDDIQTSLSVGVGNKEHYKFLKTGSELSSEWYVWIGCDIAQCFSYAFQIRIVHLSKFLSPNQHTNLSTNLRNTNNLANVLDCIRQRLLIEFKMGRSDFVRYVEELRQFAGHFLHGPITTIHVQYSSQSDNRMLSIFGIVRKELSKFCAEDTLKVGLLVGILSFEDKLQLQEITRNHHKTVVELAGVTFSYSSEWPAVVAVIELTENHQLADMVRLYLAISRARVSCSVILYPELGKNLESYRHVTYLLAELKKRCKLVLHVPE